MRGRAKPSRGGNPRWPISRIKIALEEVLRKGPVDQPDFLRGAMLRGAMRVLLQGLMEVEASQRIGAERYTPWGGPPV